MLLWPNHRVHYALVLLHLYLRTDLFKFLKAGLGIKLGRWTIGSSGLGHSCLPSYNLTALRYNRHPSLDQTDPISSWMSHRHLFKHHHHLSSDFGHLRGPLDPKEQSSIGQQPYRPLLGWNFFIQNCLINLCQGTFYSIAPKILNTPSNLHSSA